MASTGEKIAIVGGIAGVGLLLAALLWPRAQAAPPPPPTCPSGDVLANTDGSCGVGYAPDSANPGCCAPVPQCSSSVPAGACPGTGVCFDGSCVNPGEVAASGWDLQNASFVPNGGSLDNETPPQYIIEAPPLANGATAQSFTVNLTQGGNPFPTATYTIGSSLNVLTGPRPSSWIVGLAQLRSGGPYGYCQVQFTVNYSDGSMLTTETYTFT